MADPAALTAMVGAAAGLLGALTPILIERRQDRRNREADEKQSAEKMADSSVRSWSELNLALNREIERLHEDLNRIRADYEAAIDRQQREHVEAMEKQRREYEFQLAEARRRITDLETDVASLRRLLKPGQDGGP